MRPGRTAPRSATGPAGPPARRSARGRRLGQAARRRRPVPTAPVSSLLVLLAVPLATRLGAAAALVLLALRLGRRDLSGGRTAPGHVATQRRLGRDVWSRVLVLKQIERRRGGVGREGQRVDP